MVLLNTMTHKQDIFETMHQDLSYLRGRYDSDIDGIKSDIKELKELANRHAQQIGSIRLKVAMISGSVGLVAAVAWEWIKGGFNK